MLRDAALCRQVGRDILLAILYQLPSFYEGRPWSFSYVARQATLLLHLLGVSIDRRLRHAHVNQIVAAEAEASALMLCRVHPPMAGAADHRGGRVMYPSSGSDLTEETGFGLPF